MSKLETIAIVRRFYVVFFAIFVASGISFVWGIEATILQLSQSGSLFAYLIWDKRRGDKPKPTIAHFGFYGAPGIENKVNRNHGQTKP